MVKNILEVSQINSYIKLLLQGDANLKNVLVRGEISNLKNNFQSGHIYFSLKDEKCVIRAVIFSVNKKKFHFDLQNGMKVIVKGSINVYEVTGQYQLNVEMVQPDGIGATYLAYEKLKAKLLDEGLFDEMSKKQFPKFPKKVGVITSITGAVIHDIQSVMERRYPICELLLYPVKVQGDDAYLQIISGIEYFNSAKNVDAIIIARGGGSTEDLWTFNNENLARSIVRSEIPILSAVGHEVDYTICDFVADLRASTPSSAVEMIVPDKIQILEGLELNARRLNSSIMSILNSNIDVLNYNIQKINLFLSKNQIVVYKNRISDLKRNIITNFSNYITKKSSLLEKFCSKIENFYYVNILLRGYTLIYKNGKMVKSKSELSNFDKIKAIFLDGIIEFEIKNLKEVK